MNEILSPACLSVRTATPADIPHLVPMINAAYSVESFLEGTRTDAAQLAEAMKKGTILVLASEDDLPRACVYSEFREESGYLGLLAVAPEHQGLGLARVLVEAAEERFRQQGCPAIKIVVLSLRPELLPIYRRFGFVETGTEEFSIPRTLKDGQECHCVVMQKGL
jgi:GNAT superfamily N-acetyltransferase